jgi:hypothetical protein
MGAFRAVMSSRRARTLLLVPLAIVAIVAVLLLPTVLGGWAPLVHYACSPQSSPAETLFAWVPGIMLNSPYGGEAFGNATVPPGPLSASGLGTTFNLGVANGSSAWSGFRAEINITYESNTTMWGPGQDAWCGAPFAVSIQYVGGLVLGGPLLGKGNVSDTEEPTSLNHWTQPGDVNLTVSNGFTFGNTASISTCGGGSKSNVTASMQFDVWIPVSSSGPSYPLPYPLGIRETFHYVFPADLGTWKVDNLAASGGPGGGWAFSYTPCP